MKKNLFIVIGIAVVLLLIWSFASGKWAFPQKWTQNSPSKTVQQPTNKTPATKPATKQPVQPEPPPKQPATTSNPDNLLQITKLTPAEGVIGTKVTITGMGFAQTGNTVVFESPDSGKGYIRDLVSTDGKTLAFIIPQSLDPCSPETIKAQQQCPMSDAAVRPGVYAVSVMNGSGASNTLSFALK